MRRALTAAVAVPVLALAGCGGGGEPSTSAPTTAAQTGATATEGPDATAQTGAQTAAQTGSPADGDGATAAPGGAEGQAAADVAASFLVALAQARPDACDHLLSFTDIERPMTEVRADHDLCVELLPEVISAQAEAQGLDEDTAAALEGLVIEGADVDGDTAVVDGDNYPPDLAESMGDLSVRLKKVDDQWYVDLDNSFAVPTSS